jgi:hypothetical protein
MPESKMMPLEEVFLQLSKEPLTTPLYDSVLACQPTKDREKGRSKAFVGLVKSFKSRNKS